MNNERITIKANQKNRTFTIRKYLNGKRIAKFRTLPLNKSEFESCEYNTVNDWKQFLKSDDYYRVK